MMKSVILAAGLALVAAVSVSGPAMARGAIESACLSSSRTGATRALCSCIQNVANQTLTRSDQRTAARFFKDPQRAQDVRMSKSNAHNAFWSRYKAFGEAAGAYCAG